MTCGKDVDILRGLGVVVDCLHRTAIARFDDYVSNKWDQLGPR